MGNECQDATNWDDAVGVFVTSLAVATREDRNASAEGSR
jgi:hypothetical protein